MQPTAYDHINKLLDELLSAIRAIFTAKLVGVYLHGSLVVGDFDPDRSDLDLLVVLSRAVEDGEFNALKQMHDDFIAAHGEWDNRLDIDYLSRHALQTFKTRTSKMAVITPGEAFHITEVGIDWLMSWYLVREQGIALLGPPAKEVIAPIATTEFIEAVQDHIRGWHDWVNGGDKPLPQSYLILTICRALYTSKTGAQATKTQAAQWAIQRFPDHAAAINDGLKYRQPWPATSAAYQARLPETRRFYNFVIHEILS